MSQPPGNPLQPKYFMAEQGTASGAFRDFGWSGHSEGPSRRRGRNDSDGSRVEQRVLAISGTILEHGADHRIAGGGPVVCAVEPAFGWFPHDPVFPVTPRDM